VKPFGFASITAHVVLGAGADVHMFHRGDKVLIAPSVACGECFYCKKQQYSACDVTNRNKQQEQSMGHRYPLYM